MRPVQFKRFLATLPRFCFLSLCLLSLPLLATGAHAQTQEELQDQLVDSMRQASQETEQAAEKFRANDTPGGCGDLRAATMDTADSLDLTTQLSAMISHESEQTPRTRNRMLHDLTDMSATLTAQKQDIDSQISGHCG